jgi:ABC-type transport system involved in cytochrome c biogenesis permease subunit
MSGLEYWLLVISIIFYGASFLACWILRGRLPSFLLIAGLVSQAASAGIRWYGIGHPPVFGTYEAALAGSWFMLLYTAFSHRSIHGHFKALLFTTVPLAILTIAYGLTFNTERIPLTISERSLWVDFHALFSWLAFGSYAAAACLAGVYLWKSRVGSWESAEFGDSPDSTTSLCSVRKSGTVPSEVLDDLIFRYINLGFINHTVMFALGSYYSSILFGVWWQWDPVNSTSLITWLSYGLAIHMRLFYGWKGSRGANLSIVAFLTAIVSYWGLVYFPPGSTYHVFDIELKAH